MRNFRLLEPNEIECRISQVKKNGCVLLLYKTARTDYSLLDETVGFMNWANKYEVIDGKMYCCISIRNPETGEWVSKWNCGTESNTEAEKGQASDAMKRSGFAWGIGTELYSSPFIWIPAELCNIRTNENGKLVCDDKFVVTEITYDKSEDIATLTIKNDRGVTVFTHPRNKQQAENKPVSVPKPAPTATPPKLKNTQGGLKCIECGADINEKLRDYSMKKYGHAYCFDCQRKYAGK